MPGETRLNIRATKEQKEKLERAAALVGMSLTSFVLTIAVYAAEQRLAKVDGESQ